MPSEIEVAKSADIAEGRRIIVDAGGIEVGIYRHHGKLYGYQNRCPHQGGPACEGLFMPRIRDVIDKDRCYRGQDFDRENMQIVCPWHGWEFDVKTGQMVGDRIFKLIVVEVSEKQDKIYVIR